MQHKTPLGLPRPGSFPGTTEAANFASDVINSGRYTLDEDLDRFETDMINTETIFGIVSMPNDFRSSGSATTFVPTTTPVRNWPSVKTSPSS